MKILVKALVRRLPGRVGRPISIMMAMALLAASPGAARAAVTTWWVSASGGSGGAGTQGSPFQTIGTGMSHANSGDTITVETGTYYEQVTMKSGITLQGYPGQRAVISGFKNLGLGAGCNWVAYTGTTLAPPSAVYTAANAPGNVKDLYDVFTKEPIARVPTGQWATIQTVSSGTAVGSVVTITIPSQNLNFGGNLLSSFIDVFEKTHMNVFLEYYLTSVTDNGTTATLTCTNADGNAQNIAVGDTLIVCNHPTLIHNPGDWVYKLVNSGTSQLYWYCSGTAELNNVQTTIRSYGVYSSAANNFAIAGLEIAGGNYGIYISSGSNITVANCLIHDNGFGAGYPSYGIDGINCNTLTVENCLVINNYNGCSFSSDTNLNVYQTEVGFNEADGIDVGGGANIVFDECYIHNHNGLSHPDNLQFDTSTNGIFNVIVENSFFDCGDIMEADVVGMTASNNVFMGSGIPLIDRGSGQVYDGSISWVLSNNTFAYGGDSALAISATNITFSNFSISNSMFYRCILSYWSETYSDYNFFYDRNVPNADDSFAITNPPWVYYYTNPTGSQKSFAALSGSYGYEAHSTGPGSYTGAILKNAPIVQAFVEGTNLATMTTTSFTVTPGNYCSLTGHFLGSDIIEVDGDGVARTITGTSSVSSTSITISFTPALPGVSTRGLTVWDWPAGTVNLVVDMTSAATSPSLGGSSTGGPRGSIIKTAQFFSGSFDGTGTRNIPALPSNVPYAEVWHYPYNGIVP